SSPSAAARAGERSRPQWRDTPAASVAYAQPEYSRGYSGRLRPAGVARPARRTAKLALERSEVGRDGAGGRLLHGAVAFDQRPAEVRDSRRAAAASAEFRADDRPLELRVHAVDEQPRRSVRHAHAAGGSAD